MLLLVVVLHVVVGLPAHGSQLDDLEQMELGGGVQPVGLVGVAEAGLDVNVLVRVIANSMIYVDFG